MLRHKTSEMFRDEGVLCLQLTLRKCREKIIGKDERMDGGNRGVVGRGGGNDKANREAGRRRSGIFCVQV